VATAVATVADKLIYPELLSGGMKALLIFVLVALSLLVAVLLIRPTAEESGAG